MALSALKCLVVDDEPIARNGIAKFVDKVNFLELVGLAKDTDELLNQLQSKKIDLLFLDVEMPGMNGIDFIKTCEQELPLVIFITAYHNYAVESYTLQAVDYLLKPTSFERFLIAANKALEVFEFKNNISNSSESFFIRHEGQFRKVVKKEIAYISAMQNYVRIHLASGNQIIVHYSMKAISEYLDEQFLMIHKSYIVNVEYVVAFNASSVSLSESGQIPIGRTFKDSVLPKLLDI